MAFVREKRGGYAEAARLWVMPLMVVAKACIAAGVPDHRTPSDIGKLGRQVRFLPLGQQRWLTPRGAHDKLAQAERGNLARRGSSMKYGDG